MLQLTKVHEMEMRWQKDKTENDNERRRTRLKDDLDKKKGLEDKN